MIDLRRFNIAQLAKETNTSRKILHDWIQRGWLKPSQIIGCRKKYSASDFLKAEKTALDYFKKNLYKNGREILDDDFFDRLENMIYEEPEETPKKKRRRA
jgi:hypothetical protein